MLIWLCSTGTWCFGWATAFLYPVCSVMSCFTLLINPNYFQPFLVTFLFSLPLITLWVSFLCSLLLCKFSCFLIPMFSGFSPWIMLLLEIKSLLFVWILCLQQPAFGSATLHDDNIWWVDQCKTAEKSIYSIHWLGQSVYTLQRCFFVKDSVLMKLDLYFLVTLFDDFNVSCYTQALFNCRWKLCRLLLEQITRIIGMPSYASNSQRSYTLHSCLSSQVIIVVKKLNTVCGNQASVSPIQTKMNNTGWAIYTP